MHRNAIYVLLLTVAGLVAIGMVLLFSTGAFAMESKGDMYYFVKRQGLWLGVAIAGGIFAAMVDYSWWKKTWWLFFGVTFVFLLLCFVPPIGMRLNDSNRWINLVFFTFQPSELAKIASIIFLAWWFARYEKESGTFLKGLIFPLAILAVLVVPIMLEQDLGTSALIVATGLVVMFLAGTSLKWVLPMVPIGIGAILYIATHISERFGRLLAFIDPEKYKDDFYQQLQGLIAFGSGGIMGIGLGEGRQKMHFLPYASTDFIFPMVGEELGLRFTLLVVFGYLLICLCGMLVAANAKDRFGMLLGYGCVMLISLQAIVNIGVTTALLPNKGMPLPFISFGGTNLVVCFFMIGLLVNIHRHGRPLEENLSPSLKRVRTLCRL